MLLLFTMYFLWQTRHPTSQNNKNKPQKTGNSEDQSEECGVQWLTARLEICVESPTQQIKHQQTDRQGNFSPILPCLGNISQQTRARPRASRTSFWFNCRPQTKMCLLLWREQHRERGDQICRLFSPPTDWRCIVGILAGRQLPWWRFKVLCWV